jgi:excisionase family DNA binding protein
MANAEQQTIHNLIEGLHQKIAALTTLVRKLDPNYKKPGRPAPVFSPVMPERPSADELCAEGAMSIPAAAEFSGVGETRLKQLIHSGELPALKNGVKNLIPKLALVRWLAKQLEDGGAKL